MTQWHPMSYAPPDEVGVLVTDGNSIAHAALFRGDDGETEWFVEGAENPTPIYMQPTHWMHLPELPQ